MDIVRDHCMGYQNCCVCGRCQARSEGLERGALVYDRAGILRHKQLRSLENDRAVIAYMRQRGQSRTSLRAA